MPNRSTARRDGHFQFKYLPAFAVLAIPIGLLPSATAKLVWFAMLARPPRRARRDGRRLPVERRKPLRWLVVVTVVTFGKFYAHELVLGQVNILFAVVATAALLAMKAKPRGAGRRARRAGDRDQAVRGALPALAGRAAPRPVDPAAGAGSRRRRSRCRRCSYGWDGNITLHREWWRTVTETTAPNLSVYDNVSLAAMYFRWVGPGELSARLAYGTAIVLLGVTALVFFLGAACDFRKGSRARCC